MPTRGALTTTHDLIEGVNLIDKTAVITGASSGLGLETAYTLARTGCTVILCARDESKLKQSVEGVKSETDNLNIYYQVIDLQDLTSVRHAAKKIASNFPRINFLVNNAGVMATPFLRLDNGFELQFAVNHLAHFLFTLMLKKSLQAGSPSRVVNLSSGGHKHAPVNFDDLHWKKREYNKWQAYGQSKTANVLFTVGLDQRWRAKGIRAFAVHPGAIPTNLGRHLTEKDIEDLMNNSVGRGKLTFKTIPQGAATSVWAVVSPELEGKGGLYLEDCHIAECVEPGVAEHGYYAYATDSVFSDKLWDVSLKLTGLVD